MRLILTTDTVGGVWTFNRELSAELLHRGHEICLVSFGRAPSDDQEKGAADLQNLYGSRFRFLWNVSPLEWMPENISAFNDGAAMLLSLDATFVPDAYILSQFCFGALAVNAPRIVVAHSDVVSWAAACGESLDESSGWMQTYRELVCCGLANADAVVSPTAAYLQILASCYPELPQLQTAIANGKSIPFSRSPQRKMQAVTAGRMWDKAKNLQMLTDCALPMPLVVAGDLAYVSAQRNDDLHCTGHLNEGELLHLFLESVVYVCTSVYEPFGLAPLEAALCGCAVVAMDIPSLREVWGDAALYFNDAATLSAVLRDLRDNSAKLSQQQTSARTRADLYTSARMTDAYLKLVTMLVGKEHRMQAHAA